MLRFILLQECVLNEHNWNADKDQRWRPRTLESPEFSYVSLSITVYSYFKFDISFSSADWSLKWWHNLKVGSLIGQNEMIFLEDTGEFWMRLNTHKYIQSENWPKPRWKLISNHFFFFSLARGKLKSLHWSFLELKDLKWLKWFLNLTNDWNKTFADLNATDIQKRH